MIEKLKEVTGLYIYEASVCEADGVTYFLAKRSNEKLLGCVTKGKCKGDVKKLADLKGKCICIGSINHINARMIRKALPWTAPRCIGLETSIGLGDRLGLATPGHIRAVRNRGVAAILAQQSIREINRTHRTPEDVMDCATWGVLQEGFTEGFGSDADHLLLPEDIDLTVAAGFTMYTIDPGRHVINEADSLSPEALAEKYDSLDFKTLEVSPDDLKNAYAGKSFALEGGGEVSFDEESFLRAAVKYGGAIAHTVAMYRHLCDTAKGEFELEVSVDETESPTSAAEHYFFAAELKRLGVKWVSMAPRFIGRFEKGVDYIGDLDEFRKSFAQHVAVMRTLGPYKMSIHSGSDKFSIYPIIAELAEGLVHLKTAGTSYLEALRAIAETKPQLYRDILDFARGRYETDKATYHVSAHLGSVPSATELEDEELVTLLDNFDTREVLHVTFGSVLTADGGERFRAPIFAALKSHEEEHYAALAKHLGRHIQPFATK